DWVDDPPRVPGPGDCQPSSAGGLGEGADGTEVRADPRLSRSHERSFQQALREEQLHELGRARVRICWADTSLQPLADRLVLNLVPCAKIVGTCPLRARSAARRK